MPQLQFAMNKELQYKVMFGQRLTAKEKCIVMLNKIKHWFKKWKILVNTDRFKVEPFPYPYTRFELTPKQMEDAKKIYEEKGTIEYTFYPCSGIGWGCKVKVWNTNEYIDITDVSNW